MEEDLTTGQIDKICPTTRYSRPKTALRLSAAELGVRNKKREDITMILFSSRKLEIAIAEGKLPSWQKAKYIIIPTVLSGPFAWSSYVIRPIFGKKPPTLNTLISIFISILTMFIIYYGIKSCFKVNQKIDDQNFIERFCILLLPVLFKLIVIFLPISMILTGIAYAITRHDPLLSQRVPILFSVFGPLFILIYYSLLKRSFKRLGELIKIESS